MNTLLPFMKPHVFKQGKSRKVGAEIKLCEVQTQDTQMSQKSVISWHLDQTSIRCKNRKKGS